MDINIIAPVNSLGYGVVGINVVKYLSKIAKVSLWPIGNPEISTKSYKNQKISKITEIIEKSRKSQLSPVPVRERAWELH